MYTVHIRVLTFRTSWSSYAYTHTHAQILIFVRSFARSRSHLMYSKSFGFSYQLIRYCTVGECVWVCVNFHEVGYVLKMFAFFNLIFWYISHFNCWIKYKWNWISIELAFVYISPSIKLSGTKNCKGKQYKIFIFPDSDKNSFILIHRCDGKQFNLELTVKYIGLEVLDFFPIVCILLHLSGRLTDSAR